jgi:hypothetical protein
MLPPLPKTQLRQRPLALAVPAAAADTDAAAAAYEMDEHTINANRRYGKNVWAPATLRCWSRSWLAGRALPTLCAISAALAATVMGSGSSQHATHALAIIARQPSASPQQQPLARAAR